MKPGTYHVDGLGAFATRSDCVECDASNPADAACCWRCGGDLRVQTHGGVGDE